MQNTSRSYPKSYMVTTPTGYEVRYQLDTYIVNGQKITEEPTYLVKTPNGYETRKYNTQTEVYIRTPNGYVRQYPQKETKEDDVKEIYIETLNGDYIRQYPQKEDVKEDIKEDVKIKDKKEKRKPVPKAVRMRLWDREFPNNSNGRCFVCNKLVDHTNFQAGHITSVNQGGSDNINNLKIVCNSCNSSMGIMNLYEFKQMYF